MPWSAGTFTRSNGASGWANDAAGSIGITPSRHDDLDNDLATGINSCLNKTGQNSPTADLPMAGFKHTNVGAATASTHYAQLGQVQTGASLWGGTSTGSANAHVITLTPAVLSLTAGLTVRFLAGFTNTTASPTLTVNSNGATCLRGDGTAMVAGDLITGNLYQAIYNGTVFLITNVTKTPVAWTPTITASSGSVGSVVINKAAYIYDNKTVQFVLYFSCTASGGVGLIKASLPFSTGASGLGGAGGSILTNAGITRAQMWAVQAASTTIDFSQDSSLGSFSGACVFYASGSYFVN